MFLMTFWHFSIVAPAITDSKLCSHADNTNTNVRVARAARVARDEVFHYNL